MKLRWSARTDVGRMRDHNEDAYGAGEGETVDRLGLLLVICDGMGGHAAGEVASQMAVETILQAFYDDEAEDRASSLAQSFRDANARVHAEGHGKMGTTGVAAVIHHDALQVANVGDSRAYLIRDGNIRQISRDHSFVSDQVAAGLLTADEARTSPVRNVITRALGHLSDVEVDIFRFPLQVGDVVLLSSDGLHGQLTDEEIGQIAVDFQPEEAVERLVSLANERGGPDNITVILALVEKLDWESEPLPALDGASPEDSPPPEESGLLAPVSLAPTGAPAPEEPEPEALRRREPTSELPLTRLGGLLAALMLAVMAIVILASLNLSAERAPARPGATHQPTGLPTASPPPQVSPTPPAP